MQCLWFSGGIVLPFLISNIVQDVHSMSSLEACYLNNFICYLGNSNLSLLEYSVVRFTLSPSVPALLDANGFALSITFARSGWVSAANR
jgi:hypothetical protein